MHYTVVAGNVDGAKAHKQAASVSERGEEGI
jgi:hypothetical protein